MISCWIRWWHKAGPCHWYKTSSWSRALVCKVLPQRVGMVLCKYMCFFLIVHSHGSRIDVEGMEVAVIKGRILYLHVRVWQVAEVVKQRVVFSPCEGVAWWHWWPPGALGVIRQFRPIIWAENNAYFDSGGKDEFRCHEVSPVGCWFSCPRPGCGFPGSLSHCGLPMCSRRLSTWRCDLHWCRWGAEMVRNGARLLEYFIMIIMMRKGTGIKYIHLI